MVTLRVPKNIDEILTPKPEARPRIYAYSIDDQAHHGLLKVGRTTRNVKQRVAEQVRTAAIKNYTIELDETAERDDAETLHITASLFRLLPESLRALRIRSAKKSFQVIATSRQDYILSYVY